MKCTWSLLFVGGLWSAQALGAAPERVTICHFDEETTTWSAITIAEPALEAHMANHDDAVLEAGVGGTTSLTQTVLDANCVPVAVEPPPEEPAPEEPTPEEPTPEEPAPEEPAPEEPAPEEPAPEETGPDSPDQKP